MKPVTHLELLAAGCMVLACLAASIVVQSIGLSWRNAIFIAATLGAGFAAFAAIALMGVRRGLRETLGTPVRAGVARVVANVVSIAWLLAAAVIAEMLLHELLQARRSGAVLAACGALFLGVAAGQALAARLGSSTLLPYAITSIPALFVLLGLMGIAGTP